MELRVVLACLGLATSAAAQAAPRDAPAQRDPETIYGKTCGYCHGANVAPVIRGQSLTSAIIVQYVRTGPRAMPAFRQTEITDAELKALAAWISRSKADPKEYGR